jgi:hypothetical protein
MAISQANARNEIIAGLSTNSNRVLWDKATVASQLVGQYTSLWRATGVPAQGAIPAAAAYCTKALLGSISFDNQTAPVTSYLAYHTMLAATANTNLEIHDRIAHMGGLNGTLTTAQTVGINLLTINAGGPVPADRLGDANYSDIQWWLEWYTATGATASNATVNVTYDDASTGNLAVIAVGATIGASQCRSLITASNGRFVRGVNTVTLSASTATAGSFGVTATRQRASMSAPIANKIEIFDWAQLGCSEIPNDSCIFGMLLSTATSTGAIKGQGKIIHV